MFLDGLGEGAKALGGQKTQATENTGEEKNGKNNTCSVRVLMPSNLCLSHRCSINTANT